jgi:hypothetical protein
MQHSKSMNAEGDFASAESTRTHIVIGAAVALTSAAVSAVYMTQSVFALLAQRFSIDPEAARHAFGWPLLTYALVFFLVGPLSDRVRASRLASGGGWSHPRKPLHDHVASGAGS